MVHQYECDYNKYSLQLAPKKEVLFEGANLVIDDDEIAGLIEATKSFKNGIIRKVTGEIKKASRKFVTHSGAKAAEPKEKQ